MLKNKVNLVLITKDNELYEIFKVEDTNNHLLGKKNKSAVVFQTYFIFSKGEKNINNKAINILKNQNPEYKEYKNNDFSIKTINIENS